MPTYNERLQTNNTKLDSILTIVSDLPSVPDWAMQPQKPPYTASEVGALPNTTVIPTKPSDIGAQPSGSYATTTELETVRTTANDALPKTGGMLTGNLTGKYITGTLLQSTAVTAKKGLSKMAMFDNSGWLYYDVVADYIVEKGTSGIWTYQKWESGKAECWGKYSRGNINLNGSTGINGLVYSSSSLSENFPTGLFIAPPVCNATLCGVEKAGTVYASWIFTKGTPTNTSTGKYSVYRQGSAQTGVTVNIDFYCMGKWK